MNHLDLFSGIGGFALAVDTVWPGSTHTFVEIDSFCQTILKKHWPESEIHDDIRKLHPTIKPDLVTGGFPCQPFSTAGKRKGDTDNRYLWPEMLRIITKCKPTWVIGENVAGIINMALEQVCVDLEGQGYEVWPVVIPACAVGAPHRRDRVWILAHTSSNGSDDYAQNRQSCIKRSNDNAQRQSTIREPQRCNRTRLEVTDWEQDWKKVVDKLCRVDDGIPTKLDRQRIRSLGNAIVPQVAIEIMQLIEHLTVTYTGNTI